MDPKWNEDQPIYRQLRDRVVAMILEGVLGDGDALPSVRNVAAEYRLNPLTVLKGYQELVDEGLVEKKRGRGMFVNDGARTQLLKDERERFLEKEWPKVQATIERLGLDAVPFPYKMTTICFVGPSAYVPIHSAMTLFPEEFEALVTPRAAQASAISSFVGCPKSSPSGRLQMIVVKPSAASAATSSGRICEATAQVSLRR